MAGSIGIVAGSVMLAGDGTSHSQVACCQAGPPLAPGNPGQAHQRPAASAAAVSATNRRVAVSNKTGTGCLTVPASLASKLPATHAYACMLKQTGQNAADNMHTAPVDTGLGACS